MNTEIDFSKFGELIKWPQCVIIGEQITVDQAKQVLSRCDSFFWGYGSNNRKYDERIWQLIGYDDNAGWEEHEKWREAHNLLELNYLDTDFISTCYIGGVHGWCHPDGVIFDNQNIGKWPTWDEILQDCEMLADAFPFLNMKVYLFNQEHDCEGYYDYPKACVGGFAIESGNVRGLEESEYLDPSSEYCKSEGGNIIEGIKGRAGQLYEMKKRIFGNPVDLMEANTTTPYPWSLVGRIGRGILGNCENFFSEDEFKQYFSEMCIDNQ